MRIAPRLARNDPWKRDRRGASHWTDNDWLRTSALADRDASYWTVCAQIIRDRFVGRFIRPISKRTLDLEGAGFAVVAIDSLLIESLTQFQHGWPESQQGRSAEAFELFVSTQVPCVRKSWAALYSKQIRNGLLHASATLGGALILNKDDSRYPLTASRATELRVHRSPFHATIIAALSNYIEVLTGSRGGRQSVEAARVRARLRMECVCGERFYYFDFRDRLRTKPLLANNSVSVGPAKLEGWRVYQTKRIKKEPDQIDALGRQKGAQALGTLYRVDPSRTRKLDDLETKYYPQNRRQVLPIVVDGQQVWGQVYIPEPAASTEAAAWAGRLGRLIRPTREQIRQVLGGPALVWPGVESARGENEAFRCLARA